MKRKETRKHPLKFGDKRLYSLIKLPGTHKIKRIEHDSNISGEEALKRLLDELNKKKKGNK